MTNHSLHQKVSRKLQEFEDLEEIKPSEAWTDAVMSRLNSVSPSSRSMDFRTVVFVLLFLAMNTGIVLQMFKSNSEFQSLRREEALRVVSKELLINPFSISH